MSYLHPLLAKFFPAGPQAALSVLSFHRVPEVAQTGASESFELDEFEQLLDVLESDFRILPLGEGLRALSRGTLPERAVALSFDDGYVDWRTGVAPALYQRGLPATFFIATGQLSGQLLWYDRFRSILAAGVERNVLRRVFGNVVSEEVWLAPEHDCPFLLERALKYAEAKRREAVLQELEQIAGPQPATLLNDDDIRNFHTMGFDIGAHTVTHPILSRCAQDEARFEITESKRYLEDLIAAPVRGFAYPNGKPQQDFGLEHMQWVQEAGYDYAVSTAHGVAVGAVSRYAVPRFGPWQTKRSALLRHMVRNRYANEHQASLQGHKPVLQETWSEQPDVAAAPLSTPAQFPTVSVVIPVYNCFALLDEALQSVAAQSVAVLEIIVVNDGSVDGDYQHYARQYSNVRVIDKPNEGVSASRNRGVREARGEFIAFLDADDVWLPGKLAAQLRIFHADPSLGVVFGRFEKWVADAKGEFRDWRSFAPVSDLACAEPARSGWLFGKLLMGLLVGMNTAMVRRDLLMISGGFDVARRIGEDYELWLRLSRETRMASVNEVVALYRMREGSAMHALRADSELAALLQEARSRWGLAAPYCSGVTESAYRRRLAQVYFEHGYNHFWRGSRQVARQSFVSLCALQPTHLRGRVYNALASMPLAVGLARRLGASRA